MHNVWAYEFRERRRRFEGNREARPGEALHLNIVLSFRRVFESRVPRRKTCRKWHTPAQTREHASLMDARRRAVPDFVTDSSFCLTRLIRVYTQVPFFVADT